MAEKNLSEELLKPRFKYPETSFLVHRIVIVTLGTLAAGREHLGYPELPPTIASKQLLAAVGQSRLIQLWEQLFSISWCGIHIGQMLLTHADMEDRERFLYAMRAICCARCLTTILCR